MNKPAIGILVGAALGVLDGLTAWFTPEVRPFPAGILVGSYFKGIVITGAIIGFLTQRTGTTLARTLQGLAIDKTGAL
jgi:hypothetical protein